MATIVTIAAGDQITNSRADLNTNFANLNSDKIETSTLDTDTALAANSDAKIATQKAVKAYVDARTSGTTTVASGSFSKDLSATTTTTIAHGIGQTPKIVKVTGSHTSGGNPSYQSFAFTTYVGSTQSSLSSFVYDNVSGAGATGSSQTFRLVGANSGSSYLEGVITVDATNITITWTATNSTSGTAYFVWEANI